jgi:DNA-binding CsgD family transcriptional regulator
MANEVILSGRADRLDITKTLLGEEMRDGHLDGDVRGEIVSTAGHLAVLTGRTLEEYREGARLVRVSARREFGYGHVVVPMLVEALTWIEDHDDAQLLSSRQLADARRAGDALVVTSALWGEALRNLYTGHWHEAGSQFSEAIQICKAIGSDGNALAAESTFAVLQAMQGDASWVTEVDRIAEAGPRFGTHLVEELLGAALGARALAAGDGVAAIEAFGRAVAWQQRSQQFEPFTPWWPADLVEAHLLEGDEAAAREGTEALRARAEMTGQRRIAAMVARLDGLLAGGDASAQFERAIELGEGARDPYGVARSQLAYGRHLRRARQRAEARSMLTSALGAFERLGAAPWVDQARRELEATGLVLRRGKAADPQALTPQEAQVAELVSGGASNKDVAGALFVSPKTVETHLSRIYRKLGVTSRTQLAVRLREHRELVT